jgi:hypothetical protein
VDSGSSGVVVKHPVSRKTREEKRSGFIDWEFNSKDGNFSIFLQALP